MLKCKCGTEIFEHISTHKIDENNFRIWRLGEKLKPDVTTVPVMKCITCGRIYIPSCSLPGKNALDPEVIAYKELIAAVEIHNNRITNLDMDIEQTVALMVRVRQLEEACLSKTLFNPEQAAEVKDVEASKPRARGSK